jgi:hypothetical protein
LVAYQIQDRQMPQLPNPFWNPGQSEISACPFQITYHSELRHPSQGKNQILRKDLWLVQVLVLDTTLEPWLASENRSLSPAHHTSP